MLKGNKLFLALLLPVFVLALCFGAFALTEDDFIIYEGQHYTPDEWASKQQVDISLQAPDNVTPRVLLANSPNTPVDEQDEALKANPRQAPAVDKDAPLTNLMFESFESGTMPPTGWSLTQLNVNQTWGVDTYAPYDGVYYATCLYDDLYTGIQDEWMVSPAVNLTTGGTAWVLEFYWNMSYYWGVSPYDNYDLEVWISTDGGSSFSAMLWTEPTTSFTTWQWYGEQIPLTGYLTETNVKFGFRYSGYDGAQGSFDFISVNDAAPPVGRCCYGNPLAPSCADETQAACQARPDWLSWDAGLNCTSNPCPVAGAGDNCMNPLPITLSGGNYADYNQYTCGRGDDYAGVTCLGYYDGGEDIMYEITVTVPVYVNVTVDPKGTSYAGFAIGINCPPSSCVAYWTNSYLTTPFGGNVVLPAGTYYLMVDTWPSPDCIPDFDLIITDLGPPPTPPANDDCANSIYITIPSSVSGTCVGATVDCPGLLDWNGVWYDFDVTSTAGCSNLTIDFAPTSGLIYTVGVVLMDDCACDDYLLYSYIDWGYDGYHPAITWNGVTDGHWYFPCFTDDGSKAPMAFDFDIYKVDCPAAPANDQCSNAEYVAGPWPGSVTLSGTTLGATNDCPGVLDWNAVWYYFDIPAWPYGYDVTIDFCTTPDDLETVGVILMDDCACDDYILYNAIDWYACDGTNPTIFWYCLPQGTYWFPAFTGPGTYGGYERDFNITFALDTCPSPTPGDNCLDPLEVVVTPGTPPNLFSYVDNNYTCGRGNNESATCLGSYDGGEDIFYRLIVTDDICLDVTLDPLGTTWTGIALGADCPPPGSSTSQCLAYAVGSASTPKGFRYNFTAGVYYLMIDTYPAPNCIPAFDLYLNQCPPPQPGDNCSDPLKINLPADCPYTTTDSTCGRENDYSSTCMDYYDGGEDILYEVNIDVDGYYQFMMNPYTTTWTGMALGAACPPPGITYTDCIAEATDYAAAPHGFIVHLAPGTYYLMIDTWPSPNCIPMFTLDITCLAPPLLVWDKTIIEFCNVATDDTGSDILTLTNEGEAGLNFQILIQYGLPPTKEIDGANISTAGNYTPGTTADIMFTITNASSDAEWIDEFTMTFPAGVTVNTADILYCSYGNMNPVIAGQTVTWTCENVGIGCMYSADAENFNVNLTFDGGLTGGLTINYTISGDDWGNPPHDITGSLILPGPDDPYTSWLSVDPEDGTIPPAKGSVAVTVSYDATGIAPGVYFASLVINHNGGLSPITIPVTLNVGPDHDPLAIILIDRSGSMSLGAPDRLTRAKALAHVQADVFLGAGNAVAVMSFNSSDGIVLLQDFTTVVQDVHDAIDAVVLPRHDTPLAAAMCQAHCKLYAQGCGEDAIATYTDGLENYSLMMDMCYICDRCYFFHGTGWNWDCDPGSPATCTDWQLCLADVFADNSVNIVNYFGNPTNPFVKGVTPPEDLFFLKYTADASGGEFNYYADGFVFGDANGDENVNVSDAVWIINYVFAGGAAPDPYEAGNANCDETVNVSDAVWIINYVFAGGAAPGDCQ